ncbi:GNAT family N-acetyltransferase [Parendozoicomonas haliclonae]|uniref:Acetyltransferase YpeA n=1 Tax=Parendozoicomonas haliclonae TaxID=1960125 RepID=A0A1X7AR12_9GAMM|nr:GNAT family N-acetyltransferase [Parendozoicomonas haliclonae]SMA50746.1 Acetyltransferase YpeA [Parendozoicomonas haliclonae]
MTKTFDPRGIDQSWLERLQQNNEQQGYVLTECDYWQRGGEEDLAFLYSSESLTLISCSPEIRDLVAHHKPETLEQIISLTGREDLEVYIDDLDYYLTQAPVPIVARPDVEVRELTLDMHRKELQAFVECCSEDELLKADMGLDCDYFYAAYCEGQMAGLLASYCGVEPFEALSVLVKPEFRGRAVGQQLLQTLIQATTARGRIIRYRTNAENGASIRLCESMGFTQHSRIQLLARL